MTALRHDVEVEVERVVVGLVADVETPHRQAEEDEAVCLSSWGPWVCTRPQGHPGIHEAGTHVPRRVMGRCAARWSR